MLAASLPLAGQAGTFFSDTFTGASTIDQTPTTYKNVSATSYQSAIGLAGGGGTTNLGPNSVVLTCPSTGSVVGEFMALFTNTPVALATVGDNISVTVVFVNTNILCGTAGTGSTINIGLFNSGGVAPNQGNIVLSTGNTSGGTQNWLGYASRIFMSGSCNFFTRPAQTPTGSSSQNQDLLFDAASSSQTFNAPAGTALGTTTGAVTLTSGTTNTLLLTITLTSAGTLTLSNAIFAGVGTASAPIFSQIKTATGANLLTTAFDGMAVGWRNSSSPAQASSMNIASITVTGQSTPPATAPTITSQPSSVIVANGGTCAFTVAAFGSGVTYQWYRNGGILNNGGNISGATSSQLVISPAGPGDQFPVASGYYVAVTGTGNFTTNSMTNSLTLDTAHNLVWAGVGTTWDANTSANWLNGATASVFNDGDAVTFNDVGAAASTVTMTGNYLSASSFTITGSTVYNFSGSGSFGGPGILLDSDSAFVSMAVTNFHSGGTIISNATANMEMQYYAGFGTGPLTLAKAGGQLQLDQTGSLTTGVNGTVNVLDDFAIAVVPTGSFAAVFLGDLSGPVNKTLTFNLGPGNNGSTVTRIREYGTNTVYNGNLNLGSSTILYAPYETSGSQTYNGVISGVGAMIHKGTTTYFNGPNTYSGSMNLSAGMIGLGIDSAGSADAPTSGPIGTGPLLLTIDSTTTTAATAGMFAAGGAHTLYNTIEYPTGTNNLTLEIGGDNNLTLAGSFDLNGQDGITSASITSRIIQTTNTAATIISGVISDNGMNYGLTKSGTGSLYLNNANTYTGPTTNTAGLLAGTGTIAGNVVVTTNASIGGGTAGTIGTLTINGTLTLTNGNGFFRLNRSGFVSDEVSVGGTVVNNGTGTIMVTNLGAALQVGDTFTLFNKAVLNGTTLAVTGGGMNWQNNLAANGTIQAQSVFVGVNTNATNITFNVVGGTNLSLHWPTDHIGWRLQVQTNTLAVGLKPATNAWTTVPGSTTVNSNNAIINPANGAVFYRLVYP